mmetsp:Transcript_20429/g.47280  ORF Transcript_20429/g.47280 Transcript_20429/m.47280 type:complete len:93 (-) Transcript_20429:1399-1677(-)
MHGGNLDPDQRPRISGNPLFRYLLGTHNLAIAQSQPVIKLPIIGAIQLQVQERSFFQSTQQTHSNTGLIVMVADLIVRHLVATLESFLSVIL